MANIFSAIIVLHNMLREQPKEFYTSEGVMMGKMITRVIIQGSCRDERIGGFVNSFDRNNNYNL